MNRATVECSRSPRKGERFHPSCKGGIRFLRLLDLSYENQGLRSIPHASPLVQLIKIKFYVVLDKGNIPHLANSKLKLLIKILRNYDAPNAVSTKFLLY